MKKISALVIIIAISAIAKSTYANENSCSVGGNTCSFYLTDKKGGNPIETEMKEVFGGFQSSIVSKKLIPKTHTLPNLVETKDDCEQIVADYIGDKHAHYWINNFCAATEILKFAASGDI